MPETCQSEASGTFVMLPVELLDSDRCSPIALKLYCVLLKYCRQGDTAWPGTPQLAEDMHISERHVRNVMNELEECGLVTTELRPGTSNLYHVYKYTLLEAVAKAPTGEPEARPVRPVLATPAKAARTYHSTLPRKTSSHEVHVSESYKNYKRAHNSDSESDKGVKAKAPDKFYVKSVTATNPSPQVVDEAFINVKWKLVGELGHLAATSLVNKARHYGLSPQTLETLCWRSQTVPAGQKNAFIGDLLEQIIQARNGAGYTYGRLPTPASVSV